MNFNSSNNSATSTASKSHSHSSAFFIPPYKSKLNQTNSSTTLVSSLSSLSLAQQTSTSTSSSTDSLSNNTLKPIQQSSNSNNQSTLNSMSSIINSQPSTNQQQHQHQHQQQQHQHQHQQSFMNSNTTNNYNNNNQPQLSKNEYAHLYIPPPRTASSLHLPSSIHHTQRQIQLENTHSNNNNNHNNNNVSHPSNSQSLNQQSIRPVVQSKQTNGSRYGHKLTDFELMKTIGTGTFGRVYLTRFKNGNAFHAIKVLKKIDIVRLKQVEHINSEKTILAHIKHPFIVNLLCTFHDERNVYMLEEFVSGGELFSHLRRAVRFTNDVARFYAAQILLALEYLHSMNIIYRDLKPENLLLDERGNIKIADFGFAKQILDRTWTLCGTPEYLAPEIIQSKGHGKPVDWWALGILIYEMLAGCPPFYDDNAFGIYEKILSNKLSFPVYFDVFAKDLIKRLLTADISKRLGNLRGGAVDIKCHRWFRGIDWNLMINRQIQAPIIPQIQFAGDASNFDAYPEIQLNELRGPDSDPFGHLFPGF